MKQKILTARGILSALFVVLACVFTALGLYAASSKTAYADEEPADLSAAVITITGGNAGADDRFYYTGSEIVPTVTVTLNENVISNISNIYSVEIENGVEVGMATVTVTGIAPYYVGSVSKQFEILPVSLSRAVLTVKGGTGGLENEFIYTGSAIVPEVTVTLNGVVLDTAKYTVVLQDNTNTGIATVTVTGKDGYKDSLVGKFNIVEKATNSWIKQPNIESWRWLGFDETVNKLTAEAKYGTQNATFIIYDSKTVPLTYAENSTTFQLEANGEMPQAVKDKLASLAIGKYYLFATIPEGDNYSALGSVEFLPIETILDYCFPFEVLKGENSWIRTPSLLGWTWGDFKKSVNIIEAAPKYSDENTEIEYSINYSIDYSGNEAVKGLESFKTLNRFSGEVDNETARKLADLPAGTYYLRATTNDQHESYGALDIFVQFSVQKMQNYWASTPNVVQWTWSEYNPEINVITADPAFPVSGAKLTFGIFMDSLCTVRAEGIGDFTEVDTSLEVLFAALPAGNYWLKAETKNNSSNYTDLQTSVPFVIHKTRNYWTTTPNVVQWSYNSFDATVNTFSAMPAFRNVDSEVVFGIFTDRDGVRKVAGLDSFKEVDVDMVEIFNKLPAGQYWLKATTNDGSDNYSDLQTTVPFNVMPANNIWETSPYVLGWKYGEYSKEFNRVFAAPKFGTVVFSIFTDSSCAADKAVVFPETYLSDYKKFVLEENGLVPAYVAETLAKLGKGTYYLLATCAGSNNYTELNLENGVPVPFEIQAVQNSWVNVPAVTGWSEGGFNASDNAFIGEAKHGVVTFGISDSDGKLLYIALVKDGETTLTRANGEHVELDELNNLAVGSYILTAEVDGTENYSELKASTTFAVFEDSVGLAGIIAVTVVFAVLDVVAAAVCITLIVIRRRKVEAQFRNMVRKELGRR